MKRELILKKAVLSLLFAVAFATVLAAPRFAQSTYADDTDRERLYLV